MSVRTLARTRKLVVAAVVTAALATGGLTACTDTDDPKVEKNSDTEGSKKPGGEDPEKKDSAKEQSGPLAAGDTAVYKSGLKVTVSAPAAYQPSEFAAGHSPGNDSHKITITLENTGDEKITAELITPSARAGEAGVTAEQIFDENVGVGFNGKLLPGKKATAEFAFDTPPEAKNLDVEVELLDFASEPAQWNLKL